MKNLILVILATLTLTACDSDSLDPVEDAGDDASTDTDTDTDYETDSDSETDTETELDCDDFLFQAHLDMDYTCEYLTTYCPDWLSENSSSNCIMIDGECFTDYTC